MKKAENHTYCKIRVTDNGNERQTCQNCCVWLPGVIKGGGSKNYNFELEVKKAENRTYFKVRVTDNGNERKPCQSCCVWIPGAIKGVCTTTTFCWK